MQQAFLEINGVRSNVATYGRWVEEQADNSEQDIILIIPGNPGLTGFYKMFMQVLHEKTKYPVWIISHAGHEMPQNTHICTLPPLKGNEALYDLQGQTEHKAAFIRKYVPDKARLHLIGHSIGSYIILELLKDELINKQVKDVKLLFPTIEHMADTKHGKLLNTFIRPIVFIIVFMAWVFTILPKFLQTFFMFIYMRLTCTPRFHFKTLIHIVNPRILDKVFFLAFNELDTVKERVSNGVLVDNVKKIKLFYGEKDEWAPRSFCDRLKRDIPGINADCGSYDHAFVLRQSREIANLVADWL